MTPSQATKTRYTEIQENYKTCLTTRLKLPRKDARPQRQPPKGQRRLPRLKMEMSQGKKRHPQQKEVEVDQRELERLRLRRKPRLLEVLASVGGQRRSQ
nr:unnamed protein product [Callosobruchus chinensis]